MGLLTYAILSWQDVKIQIILFISNYLIVLVLHFQELDLHNVVPEQPVHHVIEFSVTLIDYGYQEILRDADSPQYHDLSQHLQDQVCENDLTVIQNFERLHEG